MKGNEYIEIVQSIIENIKTKGADSINSAAHLLSDAIINKRKIFLFGTGHSHMLAEELFYRAGGLVCVQPVLVSDLMLHISASESTVKEREEGKAQQIFTEYGMSAGDVIIIISNSGRNSIIVDMACLCKEQGLKVIALTNLNHSMSAASRHKSGKRLCQVADVVLDNCGCVGDAAVSVDGVEGNICPTSTVTGALILNAVVAECFELCVEKGVCPEHFASANVDGGDDINGKLLLKYKKEMKHL